MSVIEVIGLASGRSVSINYSEKDLEMNLLDWLTKNNITIASSCQSNGVCKKCFIQNGWLTCELTVFSFLEKQTDRKIYVSYL